jgi:hypothetical protein
MNGETTTIVEQKTTTMLLVRKKAELEDLQFMELYYVPYALVRNGGHCAARFLKHDSGHFAFVTIDGYYLHFSSLENIYVL